MPDTNGPVVLGASSSYTNLSTIIVRFSELMDPAVAAEPGNYDPAGNPTLDPDGSTVTLLLQDALTLNTTYQLQVSDLTDLVGNVIKPNPTIVTFTAGADQPGGNRPSLSIAQSTTSIVLSWPTSATGFTVQSTPVLPATNWTAIVEPIVVSNTLNTVTVPIEAGQNRFFRLFQ